MESHPPAKILLVDDEEEILAFLGSFLKRANYEVVSTTKGGEAVQLAKTAQPDLIILDCLIPDISGDEVANLLSDDPATSNIPIIFLTGLLREEEDPSQRKTARHYVVGKPVAGKELLGTIEKVLSGKPTT